MCECFNYIPAPARTRFLDTIEGRPSLSVYDAVFRLQNEMHRSAYHQLLRWADGLRECQDCRPRLKGR